MLHTIVFGIGFSGTWCVTISCSLVFDNGCGKDIFGIQKIKLLELVLNILMDINSRGVNKKEMEIKLQQIDCYSFYDYLKFDYITLEHLELDQMKLVELIIMNIGNGKKFKKKTGLRTT